MIDRSLFPVAALLLMGASSAVIALDRTHRLAAADCATIRAIDAEEADLVAAWPRLAAIAAPGAEIARASSAGIGAQASCAADLETLALRGLP